MRFYSISLTNPTTGANVLPSSLGGMAITSLLPNGQFNPSALNIELDVPQSNLEDFDANAMLRIWGLSLKDIGAALDLNGAILTLSVGMSKGLPLANPAQQGLVLRGSVYQAFGNWVGTDQTLDMNFAPINTTALAALSFPFSWKAGTPMKTAIDQTLAVAMPGYKRVIKISPKLVLNYDETGFYNTAQQFSAFLNARSKAIVGGTYRGITLSTDGTTATVADGTVAPADSAIKQIAFQDMIGQPTWIGLQEISVKFVMRGDLNIGDTIKIPPSPHTRTLSSAPLYQDQTSFTGKFQISQLHHYGNFRQPDAAAWATVAQAFAVTN